MRYGCVECSERLVGCLRRCASALLSAAAAVPYLSGKNSRGVDSALAAAHASPSPLCLAHVPQGGQVATLRACDDRRCPAGLWCRAGGPLLPILIGGRCRGDAVACGFLLATQCRRVLHGCPSAVADARPLAAADVAPQLEAAEPCTND